MKLLFVTSECAPFFKTGGLGDVAGALPKALAKKGETVAVVLPYLSLIPQKYQAQMEDAFYDYVDVGWRHQYMGVKKLAMDGVTYYFIDNDYYFGSRKLYGYFDDGERWAYFSLAVCRLIERLDFMPEVVHVNDFHTAMIPFLLKEKFNWIASYRGIKTILTIHNIEFQGAMDPNVLTELFGVGMERYFDGTIRMGTAVNFLKAGIVYADAVNTVSPNYAREIQTPEFGQGLDGVLRDHAYKLSGIVNGIDYEMNDPATDPFLAHHFSATDLTGKVAMKTLVQKNFGLPIDAHVPLIGVVSRLTKQKGFDLTLSMMDELMAHDVQVVVLGTGMAELEDGFNYFADKYPAKLSVKIMFDLKTAQEIYGGCDLFLMPSAFEPCGLSQMMAMRYGTLPIVHLVGGLRDTVNVYHPLNEKATGFGFEDYNQAGLRYAFEQAVELFWKQPEKISQMRHNAMTTDFSWTSKADQYLALYHKL